MKVQINKFEDVEKVLYEIGTREASIAKKEADMNKKITEIKDKFAADTIADRSEAELLRVKIQEFCESNKAEFNKVRSKEYTHGIVGFRNNPPKVIQLNRKYNVKTSIELLKKIFKGKFLRVKEEIDKEQILAEYSQEKIDDSKLASVGLCVEQGETFAIDIKWESLQ